MAKNLTTLGPGGASPNLATLDGDGGEHLLVMRQTSDWSNRSFVVTPSEEKFAFAAANGRPPTLHQECAALATAISSLFASASWVDGCKALFAYYTTQLDPLMLYRVGGRPLSLPTEARSGQGMTVIAQKYDLRALPLAAFDAGWKASIRLHCPSHLFHDPQGIWLPSDVWNSMGGSNTLYALASAELPDHPSAILTDPPQGDSDPRVSVALTPSGTNLNAGLAIGFQAADWFNYDPFDTQSVEVPQMPLRVYATDGDSPADFYYDLELTGTSKGVVSSHTDGGFWVLLAFKCCNGFSVDNFYGMSPSTEQGHLLYIHRTELVLSRLTKARYNV